MDGHVLLRLVYNIYRLLRVIYRLYMESVDQHKKSFDMSKHLSLLSLGPASVSKLFMGTSELLTYACSDASWRSLGLIRKSLCMLMGYWNFLVMSSDH